MAIIAAMALLAARAPWEREETVQGAASVVDGDTILLLGTRVRLSEIDAPEIAQTCMDPSGLAYACGERARSALIELIGGRQVTCAGRGLDRYGRLLGRCSAGATDLNRAMVEAGWAVAYGDFNDAQAVARQESRGLWAGIFDQPQEWRRLHGAIDDGDDRGFFARLFNFWHMSRYPSDD
ncbi:thermonuclease family protein [Mesorhizobium sp. CAU 1741]|uniref:thermonuclease family protein n=1 Tax=Mesorhizobium sp. CAU 1741 TaxID=3140366 RepID=UPI00325B82C0